MGAQVEDDGRTLREVFKLANSSTQHAGEEQQKHEHEGTAGSLLNFSKLLCAFQDRVEAVDTSLTAAVGEIARILADVAEAKLVFAESSVPHKPVNADAPTARVLQLGQRSSPQQKTSQQMENVRDDKTCLGAPSKINKNPSPNAAGRRGGTFSDPVEVQDDACSHSANSKDGGPHASRQRLSVGRRVHHNPRQRVVPCATRNGVFMPTKSGVDTILHPAADTRSHDTNYKDPPGYEEGADFGRTADPTYTGPPLQPRTNSVSAANERFTFASVRHKLPRSSLTGGLMVVADSSEAWDTLLGSASRLPERGCGRGESRCQQQVPEQPAAFGFSVPRGRAVHTLQENISTRHTAHFWG